MDHDDLTPAEVASLSGASGCPQFEQEYFQRSFREWYRKFGVTLGGAFAELLGSDVSVQGASIARVSFGEFVLSVRGTTCVLRAMTQPDFGPLFLELAPSLPGIVVDHMLGDRRSRVSESGGAVTEIEKRLVRQAYRKLAGAFCNLWVEILPVRLADVQREDDLTRSRLLRADESMTVLEYVLHLDLGTWTLRWIVPEDWPIRAVQQAIAAYCPANTGRVFSGGRLDGSDVATQHELVAELATSRVKTDDLIDLQVGDILQTDKDVGEPLTVRLDGIARFRANLGRVSDRKAVEIVEVLDHAASDSHSLNSDSLNSDSVNSDSVNSDSVNSDSVDSDSEDSDSVNERSGLPAALADDDQFSE